ECSRIMSSATVKFMTILLAVVGDFKEHQIGALFEIRVPQACRNCLLQRSTDVVMLSFSFIGDNPPFSATGCWDRPLTREGSQKEMLEQWGPATSRPEVHFCCAFWHSARCSPTRGVNPVRAPLEYCQLPIGGPGVRMSSRCCLRTYKTSFNRLARLRNGWFRI